MRIHILGICGTFMAGIAGLAKAMGHDVTGSDQNVYPPMSDVLDKLGVKYFKGYDEENLAHRPDLIIVGNATSRGNPEFEAVLNNKLTYISGPQWLSESLLHQRTVLAVAGTHGKTTTTTLLTWCLRELGHDPGYLIGGVPIGFKDSAYLGEKYFVIEADEYDTALFDKRSKFIHYHPDYLILNNLEFDHADIFRDLDDIKRQFHHLLKTIPGHGYVFVNAKDTNLHDVIDMGFWSQKVMFNDQNEWHIQSTTADFSEFDIEFKKRRVGQIQWGLIGEHNALNGLAVFAMLDRLGFEHADIVAAMNCFPSVKRRMEVIKNKDGIVVYDDFAHHPTAIKTTLNGLRARVGQARIIAVLQFASFTMRTGIHAPQHFADALKAADVVITKYSKENDQTIQALKKTLGDNFMSFDSADEIAEKIHSLKQANDHIIIMSNSSFDGLYRLL